jgi:hypothetical protein
MPTTFAYIVQYRSIKSKKIDFLHHIFVDNFFARYFCNFFNRLEVSIEQCVFDINIDLLHEKVLGLLLALFANFAVKISALAMDQIIKTPNSKCRLYWCLIELIDWRYSQSCWYFRPLFVN